MSLNTPPVNTTHAQRIKEQEHRSAALLLQQIQQVGVQADRNDFFRDTYARVLDMFERTEFASCRHLVMVGCGPLPATLLHIAQRYPRMDVLGLDTDLDALRVARQVVAGMGLNHIRLAQGNGFDHHYGDAQIVYVANLVSPKAAVLERIAQTAAAGSLVVLRDPTAAGQDQAEVGMNTLPASLKVEGTGPECVRFQSRHVFLRLLPMVLPAKVGALAPDEAPA